MKENQLVNQFPQISSDFIEVFFGLIEYQHDFLAPFFVPSINKDRIHSLLTTSVGAPLSISVSTVSLKDLKAVFVQTNKA